MGNAQHHASTEGRTDAAPLHVAAIRRYNEATAQDTDGGRTIFGDAAFWRTIAADLHAAADELTGDRRTFVRDRAKDAESRARWHELKARRAQPAIEVVDASADLDLVDALLGTPGLTGTN